MATELILNFSKKENQKKPFKEEWDKLLEKRWTNNHPSKETLCEVFKDVGSFSGVGKLYGVSDKSITKWFKHYNLPTKKQDLKKYLEM